MPNNPTGLFDNEYPYTDFHELNLSWVIVKVKNLLDRIQQLENWEEEFKEEFDKIKELYDDLLAGNFPPEFLDALNTWLDKNAIDIIGRMVKMVIFNITDDGYFVAYIPESWDEIVFNTTGLDIVLPLQPEYGHLVLSYAGNTNAY